MSILKLLFFQEALKLIDKSENEPSLAVLIEQWLERTPGLEESGFNFWQRYENAVEKLLSEEEAVIDVSKQTLNYSGKTSGKKK